MTDAASETNPQQETIGRVLGRIPSGVFIVTASDGDGRETGLLASWIQQAGFAPPTISVAVNRSRYLNDWLAKNPRLVINIVGDNQFEFLKHFGKGFEADQAAFEGLTLGRATNGLPVLLDAIGFLEGSVTVRIESGDHTIYLVEIENAGAHVSLDETKPYVHVRKNGFGY
ncbi:MAG: flavin reductase family protein [Planctomycetota bacterium]|nr:flavin reductase family protein [Planctomycetota bacterium]